MARKILHLDMDCFYAAIEVRDHPELAGKPVAVGGARDQRGVLTTCNYEAREFGVHSAMPTFKALQKCPQLIVMPTRFDVYRRESNVIRQILLKFSPWMEPLSLDEAFLDLTRHPGEASAVAEIIRHLIFQKTGLTASAGVAPNKMLASGELGGFIPTRRIRSGCAANYRSGARKSNDFLTNCPLQLAFSGRKTASVRQSYLDPPPLSRKSS